MFHDLMDGDFIFRKISLAKGGTHGYNSFVVMAMIILAYLAASDPWKSRFVFEMLVLVGIFTVGVHLYGFVRKNQPFIEHLEVVLYALLSLLAWVFYPQPPKP